MRALSILLLLVAMMACVKLAPKKYEPPALLGLFEETVQGDVELVGRWGSDFEGAVFQQLEYGDLYSIIAPAGYEETLLPESDRSKDQEGWWYECVNVRIAGSLLETTDPRYRGEPTIIVKQIEMLGPLIKDEDFSNSCIDFSRYDDDRRITNRYRRTNPVND